MSGFRAAIWAEGLKARRSRVPAFTAAAFSIAPLTGGLFMVVLKDPERARASGLLSTKAQLVGSADWPTFVSFLAEQAAVGGLMVFAFVAAWLFGREFSHRTATQLVSLPTARATLVAAKFVVMLAWSAGLLALVIALGFGVGAVVGLPGWTPALGWRGAANIAAAGGLTLLVTTPVGLAASAGRGYLAGLAWAVLSLVLAQVVAAMGWGAWFPWSVPALLAGVAGDQAADLGAHSVAIVLVTSAAGVAATMAWWRSADHTA